MPLHVHRLTQTSAMITTALCAKLQLCTVVEKYLELVAGMVVCFKGEKQPGSALFSQKLECVDEMLEFTFDT